MIKNASKLVLCLSLSSPVFAGEMARVGDTAISSETFAAALKSLGSQGEMVASNPELRRRFLDHLINSKIVAEQAKKNGFDKDPVYQARLADMANQLLAGEYMDRQIDAKSTDDAVKKWFESNKDQFSKKKVHANHILVDTEAEAKKIIADLNKPGADFEAIAKKSSKDKTVDLGAFGRGQMVPEFEKAAFAMAKGSISKEPVKTSFGWHVIKVIDTAGDDAADFATLKDEARKKFRQVAQEDFVKELRAKSTIAINEQSIKDFKMP